MEQPDHGESVAGEDQPEGKRWPSKKTMVSILILLIAALAVVVAIHLAKAKTSVQEIDREAIEQSPNSDFSFDWGNKRKGVTTMWIKSSAVLHSILTAEVT